MRNVSESSNRISKEKTRKTLQERYGKEITNISQVQEIKEKKKSTFIEHFGVDNIWKTAGYNRKCAELYPESHKKHLEKLYKGRDEFWSNATENDIARITAKASKTKSINGFYSSSLETLFCGILDSLGISYTRQFHIKGYRHPYDFRLCGSNIIIEINGNYWHANPKYYKSTDIIKYPGKSIKAEDVWERDNIWLKKAEEQGYKVLIFWEDDFRDYEKLVELLIQKLNEL